MSTKTVKHQEIANANAKLNEFKNNAKTADSTGKTDIDNISATVEKSVNDGLTKTKSKSNLNQLLKLKHTSLNNVCRTINENLETQTFKDFLNLHGLTIEDSIFADGKINVSLVRDCFPFFTNEKGQKRIAKKAPINEKRDATRTFGNYTNAEGFVIKNSKEIELNFLNKKTGKNYTLIEIQSFSIWSVLSILAKEGKSKATKAKQAKRLKDLEEKAEKAKAKEEQKALKANKGK